MLGDKFYHIAKWASLIGLPAVATFMLTLGNIWGIPVATEIGATICGVAVCVGTMLGVSNAQYKKKDTK